VLYSIFRECFFAPASDPKVSFTCVCSKWFSPKDLVQVSVPNLYVAVFGTPDMEFGIGTGFPLFFFLPSLIALLLGFLVLLAILFSIVSRPFGVPASHSLVSRSIHCVTLLSLVLLSLSLLLSRPPALQLASSTSQSPLLILASYFLYRSIRFYFFASRMPLLQQDKDLVYNTSREHSRTETGTQPSVYSLPVHHNHYPIISQRCHVQ
jgi:hypothetical protein